MKRRWLERARVVLALLAFAGFAHAAPYVVTTTADTGAGSLRQAVLDANASPGADTITFSLAGCPCTITLAAEIFITDELTIAGPGLATLAISGGNAIRPFMSSGTPVTLTDLTVRNGLGSFGGGGMRAYGPLTLARVKFLANRATNVGGGLMYGGDLVVTDSVFEQNQAIFGGGIYTEGATAHVVNTTFRANVATGQGGAIYTPGILLLENSILEQNSSVNGGGMEAWGASTVVTGTTFLRNTASNNGAGINGTDVTVSNCTFTENAAGAGGGGAKTFGTSTFTNSTFTGNTSGDGGSGVLNTGPVILVDSTFTNNTTPHTGGAVAFYAPATISGGLFTGNVGGPSFIGGGAVYIDANAGAVSISGARFEGNTAPSGAAIISYDTTGPLTISGVEFTGNVARDDGGALSLNGGTVTIDRTKFAANTATYGGAIYAGSSTTMQVTNTLFAGNAASSTQGQSMHLAGAGATSLLHVTIANAGTRLVGSAIYGSASPALLLANSIVADHLVAMRLTGGALTTDRVLVWNATPQPAPIFQGSTGATITPPLVTAGNPVFANAAGGDYRLALGSAAVDLSPTSRAATDFKGTARPQGAAHDAGFDEWVPLAQSIDFAALPDRVVGTPAFTVSATAASGLAVTFSSSTTPVCTVSGTTVTLVATGTCTIAANQAGNAFWLAAAPVSRSFAVLPVTHVLTVAKAGTGSGTVTSTPAGIQCGATCSAAFNAGTPVALSASPTAGSAFAGWAGAGCTGAGTCNLTMDAARSVTATFDLAPGVLSPSPASLDFGGQSMNTTAPAQSITFTNTGGLPVAVTSVTASTWFAVAHDCTTVNANASCTATVTFTPAAEGSLNGTLTVQTDSGNTMVPLAGTGERSLVTHYYRSILRRAPDAGGKAFWESERVRLPALGASVNETWYAMATYFYFSPEYESFARDDVGFVTDLYNTFFNRGPDAGGLGFWTGQMGSGMPREVVLVSFMFSAEFQSFTQAIFGNVQTRKEVDTVMDFYRGLLSRLPDDGGFASWVGQFRAAQCQGAGSVYPAVEAISNSFASGAEYASRNRTNAQYVGDLYNAFLRRGGDLGGVQFWIDQIATGARSRAQVRQDFIASAEFTNRVAAIIADGCLPEASRPAGGPAGRLTSITPVMTPGAASRRAGRRVPP